MRVINTVLLSYGMSGKIFHAPFLEANNCFNLIGAWERSNRQIQMDYPRTRSFGSLEEALADPATDLVIVNTPTSTHAEFATKALLAGKHVVVEKAFATNAQEAVKLGLLAASVGKKLSVYQNRRWDSDFKTVQHVHASHRVGTVTGALIAYERFNPTLSSKSHRETPGPGAGNLMDLGPHCIDQAVTLFGMPQGVFADIQSLRPGSLVDDYFDVLLSYPSLRVRIKSTYLARDPGPGFILNGSLGSFVKSRADVQESQLKQGMKPIDPAYGIEPESEYGWLHLGKDSSESKERIKSLPGNYMEYYKQLYRAIVADEPVPVTPEDGVSVMRIIDAAWESSSTKRNVEL